MELTIDGKRVAAREGDSVLSASLRAGIYIPHLCFLEGEKTQLAACRLCLVEIEGRAQPVTACTEPASGGLAVRTATEQVRRLQRTAAELLIASYNRDCGRCPKNGRCQFQQLVAFLGLKLTSKRFARTAITAPVDASHPGFVRDPGRCLLCGKCVRVCREKVGAAVLDFTHRGFETVIRPFSGRIADNPACASCVECMKVCPAGGITPKVTQ